MKNNGGRPLKLTNEVREALIVGVRQGLTFKTACKSAGISYSTFANWRQKSRKLLTQGTEDLELYKFISIIDEEMCRLLHQHRLKVMADLKPRDYRHGWKNPMRNETKQKLRVKAFEKAVENVMLRRNYG